MTLALARPRHAATFFLVISLFVGSAPAETFVYPDPIDPNISNWDATAGITAGNTVILQRNATYSSSVSPVVNDGTLQFDDSSSAFQNPYIFSLNLSGTGQVATVSGVASLTGTNSYSGGTVISSATGLIVTTSALPGAVTNQGTLWFQQNSSGTFAGAITGGGRIERYGSGTVTLTGTNAAASEIYNDAFGGRLVGNTDSLKGPIFNETAALEFNQTTDGTFQGNFGTFATGNVYKTGVAALTLTGNNRLQSAGGSDLFIDAGRVVGTAQALDFNGTITIAAGAELRIDEPDGTPSNLMQTEIVGAGSVYKTGAGTVDMTQVLNDYGGLTTVAQGKVIYSAIQMPQSSTTNLYGEIRMTGSGVGNSAGITITTGGGGGSPTEIDYPGLLTGGGSVTVSGGNHLILSGANTYTGGTFVDSGRVIGSTQTMPGPITLNGGGGLAEVEYRQTSDATTSTAIEGIGSIYKTGTGSLTLSGTSSVAGDIYVRGGRLAVNGSMANISMARVETGGVLGGSGTIGSNQQFFVGIELQGGRLEPGNSAGVITTNDMAVYSGSAIEWELMTNTAAAGARGTSYDGINLTNGNLSIDSGATLDLVFNAAGSSVHWWNPLWDANQSWVLIDNAANATLVEGVFSNFNVGLDSVGGDLSTLRPGASFTAALSGGDVVINYTSAALVPEPSTLALAAAAGLGGLVALRRRRRTVAE